MRLLRILPVLVALQFCTQNAFAVACINGPDPNSASRLIPRMYGRLWQGGTMYLVDVFLIVAAYYICKRFKLTNERMAHWFVIAAAIAGMWAVRYRFFMSSGGYCNSITTSQDYAESAAIWLVLSVTFYAGYKLILRIDERYRHFVALGAPIGVAIGLPATSILAFLIKGLFQSH